MDYIQLTRKNGSKVLIPVDSIKCIEQDLAHFNTIVHLESLTFHVEEKYKNIVQMIDSLT